MNNLLTPRWPAGGGFSRLDDDGTAPSSDVELGSVGSHDGRPQGQSKGNGGEQNADAEPEVAEFDRTVFSIQDDVREVMAAVTALEKTHKEASQAAQVASVSTLKQRMTEEVALVSQLAKKVKQRIETLQHENGQSRLHRPGCGPGSATDRHRTTVTHSLGRRLRDVMLEFSELRTAMDATHRAEVERQVQIVTGEKLSAAELDRIMEAGGSEEVLKAAVEGQGSASSGGTAALREAVLEISVRHDAVKEVTKSLMELQQMFLDMATLVEAQGEALDSIESHVEGAVDHVAHARKELTTAEEIQKNTRKWRLITAGIVALVFLVIFIPVISSVARK